jgi:hypothetical protein
VQLITAIVKIIKNMLPSFFFRPCIILIFMGFILKVNAFGHSAGLEPVRAEELLTVLFAELAGAGSADRRRVVNDSITMVFEQALKHPDSFNYPYDSLSFVGRITAPDSLLRVFTWNYSDSPVSYRYFGFLQLRDKSTDETLVYFLDHHRAGREDFENRVFGPENWYGALYYQVQDKVCSGKPCYALIGYDLNSIYSRIKIIDILTFNGGSPVFGAPVFHFREGVRQRVVFEYSSGVVMFLRYVPERDMIIYDHLSPASPRVKGQYRYYGPDFSYDGLRFENGRWIHTPDVDWKQPNQSFPGAGQ